VALLDYQQLLASHDMPPCGNEGQTCRCEADVWETERMVHGFLLVGRNPENPGDRSTLGDYRSGKSRGRGKAPLLRDAVCAEVSWMSRATIATIANRATIAAGPP